MVEETNNDTDTQKTFAEDATNKTTSKKQEESRTTPSRSGTRAARQGSKLFKSPKAMKCSKSKCTEAQMNE